MTAIEWTDVTDNIITVKGGGWWCRMISEGCANCYAARLNMSSYFGGNKLPYTGDPPELVLNVPLIESWRRMTKPKRHFVASMTDVFGDWVTQAMATTFLRGMWAAPKQTFQVLTKRPDVALDRINNWLKFDGLSRVPDNIQIGTSVENQKWADIRISDLLKIRAKVLFLSIEPMLGPIDLWGARYKKPFGGQAGAISANWPPSVNWVIVGGESGPKARPCNLEWIRCIVKDCAAVGVPCFVKQLGKHVVDATGCFTSDFGPENAVARAKAAEHPQRIHLKHPKGGDMAEWPEALRVRQFPA